MDTEMTNTTAQPEPAKMLTIDNIQGKIQDLGFLCTNYDSEGNNFDLIRNNSEIAIDLANADAYYLAFIDKKQKFDDENWLIDGAIVTKRALWFGEWLCVEFFDSI